MTYNKIPNVHSDKPRKRNLVDPATLTVSGVFLFVLAESAKAIIGFLTLQWFARLWKEWTSDEPNNQKLPKEESDKSNTHCPCGRCHGG